MCVFVLRMFTTFIAIAAILVLPQEARSDWTLVEDFSQSTIGALNGQTASNGMTWTASTQCDAYSLEGNKVMKNSNNVELAVSYLPFDAPLYTGTTWTLFYRVRYEELGGVNEDDPFSFDFDMGPSDSTAPFEYNDKTHSFRSKWQEMMFSYVASGRTAPWDIDIADVWFYVWHVIDLADASNDQTDNTVRAYLQGGLVQEQEPAIIASSGYTDLGFRDYSGGPLYTFFLMNGSRGGCAPTAYIDDVYIAQGDWHESSPVPIELPKIPMGDANYDLKVDAADAAILAANWLATDVGWKGGDFNDDGIVDDVDATLLATNWQAGAVVTAVPEPSATMLLSFISILLPGLHLFRRR